MVTLSAWSALFHGWPYFMDVSIVEALEKDDVTNIVSDVLRNILIAQGQVECCCS